MALVYYYVVFGISLLLLGVYAYIFHKHYDVNITIIAVLVPIMNLSNLLIALSQNIDQAINALKMTYIGGCFILLSALFLILKICDFKLKPWMRTILIVLSISVFISSLTIGYSDIFYKDMPTLSNAYGASYITDKHYGFMHTVFYVLVGFYYAAAVAAVIYSFIKKKQVSRTILILVAVSITVSMIGFFGGRLITKTLETLPATYTIGLILYMVLAARLRLYDPSDSVTDSLVEKGDKGFISFDHKMRYLGSNETAKEMLNELRDCVIDKPIKDESLFTDFSNWVNEFENDNNNNKHHLKRDDKTYLIEVNRLMMNHFFHIDKGYQFFITDDTKNQQYITLISNYNNQLEQEVVEKTKHIIDMHDKLVLGMATMVEGRDNSTGGHIKRTSDCIAILVDEIRKDNFLKLDDEFCKDLIKAAPMHDLGKITVDDSVLRKPGRYTPEEFNEMKKHAAEGARIVKQILEGTDDKKFMEIAVNVAHYHHERFDGSGYPKGLKGEEIPLEARIMAIADVYDALVSKRVYKDRMSFEDADEIIMEGMGKHFDKNLEPYYVKARPRLEEYYRNTDC